MEKNEILDPICCLFRLALLCHKKKGTKLSICNNRIAYHIPATYQGVLRFYRKDHRGDLHNLRKPLVKCTERYEYGREAWFDELVGECVSGLRMLKTAYPGQHFIGDMIEFYIRILDGAGDAGPRGFPMLADERAPITLADCIRGMWDISEIRTLARLLSRLKEDRLPHEKKAYTEAIEVIISSKEDTLHNMLLEFSTRLM